MEADDRHEVLCVGRVKPEEQLMSSAAEADKSSAAEAAVGLDDEAVIAAVST